MIGRMPILLGGVVVVLFLTGCTEEVSEIQSNLATISSKSQIVAKVNGVSIYKEEFENTLRHAQTTRMRPDGNLEDTDKSTLGQKILQKMIQDELLVQHARSQNISVTPSEIQLKFEQIKIQGGGEAAFIAFLEQRGLDRTSAATNLERNMIIERLTEKIRAAESVSEKEITTYYESHPEEFRTEGTVQLAHILFKKNEMNPDPVARAENLRKRIMAGLTFEEAAKKYSEDSATSQLGGVLGKIKKGEFLPQIEKAAFAISVGEISKPVESPLGIHLLRISQRTDGSLQGISEASTVIEKKLLDSRVRIRIQELADQLARDGSVELSGLF
ncbi:MAG: peptidylprolyl isomerase [Deltaproteobacteria bacterium]|nr:peptidylprolyl isomerase [Deltaproteobacteria bacterium]